MFKELHVFCTVFYMCGTSLTSTGVNVFIPLTETRKNNWSKPTYKENDPNYGMVKAIALTSK